MMEIKIDLLHNVGNLWRGDTTKAPLEPGTSLGEVCLAAPWWREHVQCWNISCREDWCDIMGCLVMSVLVRANYFVLSRTEINLHQHSGDQGTSSHPWPQPVWSTLIGPGMSRLGSHWSRASPVMLAPAILCHKEPARGKQNTPQWGYFAFQSP